MPFSMKRPIVRAAFVAALLPASLLHAQRIIYVNDDAQGASDGSSWTNAYVDLQDALDDARAGGDIDAEIWIAAGTFRPDRGTRDPTLAFELFGNIALYGGFSGHEDCREDRDPSLNETILTGDLLGDDDLTEPSADCCVSGISVGSCSDPACFAAVVAVRPDCAQYWRGICTGIALSNCCELCRPTRCDNAYNVAQALEVGSAPTLDGLTISDGEALSEEAIGIPAGFYSNRASPTITRCTFRRNRGSQVSALYTFLGSPTVSDSSFIENGWNYAAFLDDPDSPLLLDGLYFAENAAVGLNIDYAEAAITRSTFRSNEGRGLRCGYFSDCTIENCLVVSNGGGGMFGGGVTRVVHSLFLGNALLEALFTDGPTLVQNSLFAGNGGAGAVVARAGGVHMLNSVVQGNIDGGALSIGEGGATIRNSVLWANCDQGSCGERAQISALSTTVINVQHSIVQGWTGSLGGVGNSGMDPMFVDADGPDDIPGTEDDDLRLSPGSPAINAGDPDETYLPPTDLDGHARVLCGRVDIGAYEFGIGDYDCDQSVDLSDFAAWETCMDGPLADKPPVAPEGCEAFDFNADGSADLLDFAGFQNAFPSDN